MHPTIAHEFINLTGLLNWEIKCRQGGSNPRPSDHESGVLSLSYAGVLWIQHSCVLSVLFKVLLGGKRARVQENNRRSDQPVRRGAPYLEDTILKMGVERARECETKKTSQ